MKRKISKVFEKQYFDLNTAINKSYISNGIGCLAAKVSDFNDIISRFSGEGYECLNHEFYSYLDRNLQYIPDNVPILLEVYGCKFSKEQKEVIIENIREHYQYKLGEVIEANKAKLLRIGTFLVLTVLLLIGYIATESNSYISDSLNLAFVFFGSAVISFLATDLTGPRQRRARAGQMANMYIIVEEKYNPNPITDEDKEIIYNFLKQSNKK